MGAEGDAVPSTMNQDPTEKVVMSQRAVRASLILAVTIALLLVISTTARAANSPDPGLDQVATKVAGHPVTVWCEANQAEYDAMSAGGLKSDGFTRPPGFLLYRPVVYIAPEPCGALHKLLDRAPIDSWAAARGIRVLLHEATHQLGGIYGFDQPGDPPGQHLFEGRTDCNALTLIPKYMPLFGITRTTPGTTSFAHQHRKKVKRQHRLVWKRWVTYSSERTTVANPMWSWVQTDAKKQHDGIGKRYPQYQGDC